MDNSQKRIADIIPSDYWDFLSYCDDARKVFVSDLNTVDFIAFRSISGQNKDYIRKIKDILYHQSSDSIVKTDPPQVEYMSATGELFYVPDQEDEADNTIIVEDVSFTEDTNESVCDGDSKGSSVEHDKLDIQEVNDKKAVSVPSQKTYLKNKYLVLSDNDNTIASYFNVNAADYDKSSIEKLNLSVRSKNCLTKSGLTIIAGILSITPFDLINIPNMGAKSIDEIVSKLKAFVSVSLNSDLFQEHRIIYNDSARLDANFKSIVNSYLKDEEYDISSFSTAQTEYFEKIQNAASFLGKDLCKEILSNQKAWKEIDECLNVFSKPFIDYYNSLNTISQKISVLSENVKNKKLLPFIKAYLATAESNVLFRFSKYAEDYCIKDVPYIYDKLSKDKLYPDFVMGLSPFLAWLKFDGEIFKGLKDKIESVLGKKDGRLLEIFTRRAKGETLEAIGTQYGVTRELVRQQEKKAYWKIKTVLQALNYDPVMLVYALRNGDNVLYFNELEEIAGEASFYIWNYIKKEPNHYYYSEVFDAIMILENNEVVSDEKMTFQINVELASLPEIIDSEKKNEIVESIAKKVGIPVDVCEKSFDNLYKKTGLFYHKMRLTVVYMCGYVLKHYFSAGFKIADKIDSERFSKYLIEIFGEKAANITARAIDAKACEIGVLCDRGKYIHPDYLEVSKTVMKAVYDYIEQSPHSVIPYGEIYEALQDVFVSTQITNKYILQGAMKKYGCKYRNCRDYVRKSQDGSFVDEIDNFVRERGVVHKSEICAEYPSINDFNLGLVVSRSSNVFSIDGGNYIHACQFDIHSEDYEIIKQYLQNACKDIPISIRSVQEALLVECPDFMCRNDFEDRNKLFAALMYMFRADFSFSRPYIAKLGVNDITNKSVLLRHIEEYDSIDIDELMDICDENNIKFPAVSSLIQTLSPEYLRINNSTLMKYELTGITDAVIDSVIQILQDWIRLKDYCVGAKISDFIWFPQIEIDWNEFILESALFRNKNINIVYLIGDTNKHSNAVYVSEKYKGETFDSFVLRLVSDEVKKGSFLTKSDIRDWLRDEGIIEGKLPYFLESDRYFYEDNTGIHFTKNSK